MSLVSIIIPIYNVEKYLDKCIKSVLNQTFEDFELLLIDDGSTDNSGKICDAYSLQDSRIKVFHIDNGGVSHARNIGIENSNSQIICFIDSDDWVDEKYLSSMLKYSIDDDTLVYGNVTHDRLRYRKSSIGFPYMEGDCWIDSQVADFFVRNRIPENGYPVAKFFRKRIITQFHLRFDERISLHEDHLFVLQYLLHVKKIVLTADASYHYVHRDTGLSLSSKTHPAKKMIIASDALIKAVGEIVTRFNITDKRYINVLYTKLGLSQLIRAVQGMTICNYKEVSEAVKSRLGLFYKYYSPAHVYARFVPVLIVLGLGKFFVWINKIR